MARTIYLPYPPTKRVSKRRPTSKTSSSWMETSPDWSKLVPELLELILSKLSFINVLRFQAVCPSWNSAAKSYISSSLYSPSSQRPWLMLPNTRQILLSEEEKDNLTGEDSWCVGSCNGWLVLLDKEAEPFLVNPFSSSRQIKLPAIDTFPCKTVVDKQYFIEYLRKSYIRRAVLFGDPSTEGNFGVVVLYDCFSMLAFWKNGDCVWNPLPGPPKVYYDVMVCDELIYALTDCYVVEIWDLLGSSPVKRRVIKTSVSKKMLEVNELYHDRHSSRCYLVESSGDLLLVVRYIGDFVNGEGMAVEEKDLLSDEDTHPLVCPYRTLMFYVYKLDLDEKTWAQVHSLGKRALYLGGNNSVSLSVEGLSGVEGNTIYFTDDNWDQMNEDYLYGGHDLGKFNLEEKVVKPILKTDFDRIDPPPFWIFPNPL